MTRKKLLTSKEMASILGIAQITVQRSAARGELPGRKAAGRWRFDLREVEKMFKAKSDIPADRDSSLLLAALEEINSKLDAISKQLGKIQGGRR